MLADGLDGPQIERPAAEDGSMRQTLWIRLWYADVGEDSLQHMHSSRRKDLRTLGYLPAHFRLLQTEMHRLTPLVRPPRLGPICGYL